MKSPHDCYDCGTCEWCIERSERHAAEMEATAEDNVPSWGEMMARPEPAQPEPRWVSEWFPGLMATNGVNVLGYAERTLWRSIASPVPKAEPIELHYTARVPVWQWTVVANWLRHCGYTVAVKRAASVVEYER